jgi:flavorubredoxin
LRAIVVYESHWGNTAAVARAIAEGLGPEARALSTAEATHEVVAAAALVVAGAPILGFQLPTDEMVRNLTNERSPSPADLSHPSLRAWLAALPRGSAAAAAFETRIWWSFGSAAKTILQHLEQAGYRPVAQPQKFIVKGRYGPLRDGELAKARAWGAELARAVGAE